MIHHIVTVKRASSEFKQVRICTKIFRNYIFNNLIHCRYLYKCYYGKYAPNNFLYFDL